MNNSWSFMDIRVKIKNIRNESTSIPIPKVTKTFHLTIPSAWFFIEHEVRFFSETQ